MKLHLTRTLRYPVNTLAISNSHLNLFDSIQLTMSFFRPSLGMMGIPGPVPLHVPVVICANCGQRGHASWECGNQRQPQPVAVLNHGGGLAFVVNGLVPVAQASQACRHCGRFGHQPGNCSFAPSAAAAVVLRCNAPGCNQNHSQHHCNVCGDMDANHRSSVCPRQCDCGTFGHTRADHVCGTCGVRGHRSRAHALAGIAAPARVVAAPARVVAAPARVVAAPARVVAAPARVVAAPARVVAAPARVVAALAGNFCTSCGTVRGTSSRFCGQCGDEH